MCMLSLGVNVDTLFCVCHLTRGRVRFVTVSTTATKPHIAPPAPFGAFSDSVDVGHVTWQIK